MDLRAAASTTVTGIVLAGGSSRRFPPDKLALVVDGRPLLWRAIESVATVCDEIIVVIGHAAPPPELPSSAVPIRVVRDRVADAGPVAGLAAALDAAHGEWALVAAGDTPHLRPELLRPLRERAVASGRDGAVLVSGGLPRPLPAILRRRTALTAAHALRIDAGPALRDVVTALDVEALGEEWWRAHDPTGAWRDDIDRPEDLRPHGSG